MCCMRQSHRQCCSVNLTSSHIHPSIPYQRTAAPDQVCAAVVVLAGLVQTHTASTRSGTDGASSPDHRPHVLVRLLSSVGGLLPGLRQGCEPTPLYRPCRPLHSCLQTE